MTFDQENPCTWSRSSTYIIGLDTGFHSDHSAIVVGGVWPQAPSSTIGVVHIEQLPLQKPMTEVADLAAKLAREYSARVVVDLTNNTAFADSLATRLGRNPADHMLATTITGADTHALMPTPMQVS